jgi:hypothetical protein
VRVRARLTRCARLLWRAAQACITCVGGFSLASAPAGDALPFHVALLSRTFEPLQLHAATLELHAGEEVFTADLLRATAGSSGALAARAWTVFSCSVPAPAAGAVRAAAVLLQVGAHATLRCPLVEAAAPADADPLAPADPLTVGTAHVVRLGGIVGQLSVCSTAAVPSATLAISSAALALAGQVFRIDVGISAVVRHGCVCACGAACLTRRRAGRRAARAHVPAAVRDAGGRRKAGRCAARAVHIRRRHAQLAAAVRRAVVRRCAAAHALRL